MGCNVMPLKKYAEISYRVKCVAVENERVFGDVYVTQQTRNLLYCADGYQFPSLYERRRCNLIQKEWKGPDFMELNRKKPIRRASFVPLEAEKRKRLKRSKSMGDTRNVAVDWTTASDGIKSDVNNICKPKVRIFVSNQYFSSSSSLHFSTFTKDQRIISFFGVCFATVVSTTVTQSTGEERRGRFFVGRSIVVGYLRVARR